MQGYSPTKPTVKKVVPVDILHIDAIWRMFSAKYGDYQLNSGQSIAAEKQFWIKALKQYAPKDLNKAAEFYMLNQKRDYWPTAVQILDILKEWGVKPYSPPALQTAESMAYDGFVKWYEQYIMPVNSCAMWDNNKAPYLMQNDLQAALNCVIMTEQAKQKKWGFKEATIQAWMRGDFVRRFEKAISDIRKDKEEE